MFDAWLSTRSRRNLADALRSAKTTETQTSHRGASMTTIDSDPTTTATEDRLAILELTARLALLVDARDWTALEGLFTDPIYSDRTSLFGGEPETSTPAELAGGLRYALGGLD